MDLFLNTDARDKRHALVASLTDRGEIPFPALNYGDTVALAVYLVTQAGGYHADAGSADLTCTLSLGPRDQPSLIASPGFTAAQGTSNKAFAATLELTGDDLALVLAAGARAPLVLTFATTNADDEKTTWLVAEVDILGSIA